MGQPLGDATACIITFDSLVRFAQQGWEYPLEDNPATRDAIYTYLQEQGIPLMTLPNTEQIKELISGPA